jgi:ribosome-associated heat shock protein Hsp15
MLPELEETLRALTTIPEHRVASSALGGCEIGIECRTLPFPLRPLGPRHLTNHQSTRGNLLTDVLELRLARLGRSLLHSSHPLSLVARAADHDPGLASYCDHGVVDHVRIDKWLWASRMFKTRSAATRAVLGGRIHVNGERVKPSKVIRSGDTIDVTIRTVRRTLVVTGVGERRGPASDALTMYAETPESLVARELHAAEPRLSRPLGADLGTRPTKQARRRLDALRRGQRRTR